MLENFKQYLINKGYIEKIQSETDRREYHLKVTDKYYKYFNLAQDYLNTVVARSREHFSAEDVDKLEEMLRSISRELMPEGNIPTEE